jgi:hypothetical protein
LSSLGGQSLPDLHNDDDNNDNNNNNPLRPSQSARVVLSPSAVSRKLNNLAKAQTQSVKNLGLDPESAHASLSQHSQMRAIDDHVLASYRRTRAALERSASSLPHSERVDMAAVLLFDAIHELTTRHRMHTVSDRRLYLFLHGPTFRTLVCCPISFIHLLLIFIESRASEYTFAHRLPIAMAINFACIAFHFAHFVTRLYLRRTPIAEPRANANANANTTNASVRIARSLARTTKSYLFGASEQFEAVAIVSLLAMVIDNSVHLASGYTTPLLTRALRVIFLIDSINILKRLIRNTLSSLIALREVLLLGASMIGFFALTAIIVWPPATTAQGTTHFYSVHRSIMTFTFASMGAVNFPDISKCSDLTSGATFFVVVIF